MTSTALILPAVPCVFPGLPPSASDTAAGLFTLRLISPLSWMSQDVKGCEFNIDFIKYFYCNMSAWIRLKHSTARAVSRVCTQCGFAGPLTEQLTGASALFIKATVCCESKDSTQLPAIRPSCVHIGALCIHWQQKQIGDISFADP